MSNQNNPFHPSQIYPDKDWTSSAHGWNWTDKTPPCASDGCCESRGATSFSQTEPVKPEPPVTSISNCEFYGVKWDADAMGTVALLAQALVANADAIRTNADAVTRLADMFKAGNVNIEAMVRFDGTSS